MIKVNGLTKKFGDNTAIKNVSFELKKGEILGFLGPNGAGKSTAMNIITGCLSPTEGSAVIGGYDILENPIEAKRLMGFLPENPPLYLDMTVEEYLNFVYRLKKSALPNLEHIKEACEMTKIEDVFKRPIKNLSRGYRQRIGLAQALIGDPEILILDEPTAGLDPNQIIDTRKLIKKLGKTHTILLSAHVLTEIQNVCDRVIILREGEVVADDTAENLSKGMPDKRRLTIRTIESSGEETLAVLSQITGVKSVKEVKSREENSREFLINIDGNTDPRRAIFERLSERRIIMTAMIPGETSLEDIFLKLTQTEAGPDKNRIKSKRERKGK